MTQFNFRADVNCISRELKLTDNRANKAEVDAGHFEDFLIDKKTKLIPVLDGEKAEKVLNVRVSCDVISVL